MHKDLLKNILRPLSLLFYVLLTTIIILFFVLFYTEIGLKLSVKIAEKLSNETLNVEQVSGTLSKEIKLKKLTLKTPSRIFLVKNSNIQWRPFALFRGQLKFEKLNIASIAIETIYEEDGELLPSNLKKIEPQKKNSEKTKKPEEEIKELASSIPQLPFYLIINQLKIKSISILSDNETTFSAKNIKGKIALTNKQLENNIQASIFKPIPMRANFNLSGHKTLYHFELNLKGTGSPSNQPQLNWKLTGQGNQTQLAFNTKENEILGGKLNINGWIKSPTPEIKVEAPVSIISPKKLLEKPPIQTETKLNWYLSLEAINIDLSSLFPAKINGTLVAQGANKKGKITLKINKTLYEKEEVSGEALLHFNYPSVTAFNAYFHSGPKNNLAMQGNIKDNWNLTWKANIESLNEWLPNFKGKLKTHGKIFGKLESPDVNAEIKIKDFEGWSGITAKDIYGYAAFSTTSLLDSKIIIDIKEIQNGIFKTSYISLSGKVSEAPNGFKVRLKLKPGNFEYPFEGSQIKETFKGGTWDIAVNEKQIRTQLDLSLMGDSNFKGKAILPRKLKQKSHKKIQAQLKGRVNNLSFLSALTSPTVRNIQGQLMTDLRIGGTVKKPIIRTRFELKAEAFLPVPNLNITNIEFSAVGNGQVVRYKGQAQSKDTTLKLTGQTKFKSKSVVSEFIIESDRFLVTNTPEIQIYATSKLKLSSKDKKTEITGTVHIPEASIKPIDFRTVVTLPDDVQFVHKEKRKSAFPVSSNIKLTLGDDIQLQYEGLKSALAGGIEIVSLPDQPTTATGKIKIVDGVYSIRGRDLNIHKGLLNFNGGPINNPRLQIQATRTVQVNNIGGADPNLDFGMSEVLVGVDISGSLRRNKIRLFSEPSGLSQSNIMAYLVTGQSASAGAGSYLPLLLDAAGGKQANQVSDKIKNKTGLSSVSIQDSKALDTPGAEKTVKSGPALVLGKALSPFLYINYSMGLLEPLGRLQANYQFAKGWLLQITGIPGDKGASIDIIRSIESND